MDRMGRGGGFYLVLSAAVTFYDGQIARNAEMFRRVLSSKAAMSCLQMAGNRICRLGGGG